jgi:hypothetical protein
VFPTSNTQQTAASTIPTPQAHLRSEGAVHQRHGNVSIAPPKRQEISLRRSSVLSYIMRYVSTAPCLRHWGLLLHNRQTQPGTQCIRYVNFWTMPLLILMQSSHTTQVTWSSQDTATHHTSPNQRHAAK